MKKILAFIFALILAFAALPVNAYAWTLHGDIYTSIRVDGKDAWGNFYGSWHYVTWTGNEIKPSVVIWQSCSERIDGNDLTERKCLLEGKDYKMTLGNNVDMGYCRVNITGMGDYGDVNLVQEAFSSNLEALTEEDYLLIHDTDYIKGPLFVIRPLGTTLNKVIPQKKAVKVTWKRQSKKMSVKRITGYQIQLSTKKDFKSNTKTVTVKGYKNTAKTVKKLKGKKKYYVRVRTYFECKDGFRAYSTWSKSKTVKTK